MEASIIIPAHNEEASIKGAIESVLKQTFKDYELIVVNDSSTDKTKEIVESYIKKDKRIKLINIKGGNAAKARNAGLRIAKGKYIIFVDADITFNKHFIKKIINHFKEQKADAVTWNVYTKNPKTMVSKMINERYKKFQSRILKPGFEKGAYVFTFKKSVIKKLGGYDESVSYFEDYLITKKFYEMGFKAYHDPQLIVFHEDPNTLIDYLKQGVSYGKGLSTLYKKDKWHALKMLLINFCRASIFLLIILNALIPISVILTVAYVAVLLIINYYGIKLIHVTLYSIIVGILRSLVTIFYFFKTSYF